MILKTQEKVKIVRILESYEVKWEETRLKIKVNVTSSTNISVSWRLAYIQVTQETKQDPDHLASGRIL